MTRRLARPAPAVWAAGLAFTVAAVLAAPPAAADANDNLRTGVSGLRGTSCGPLRSDPLVEQTAEQVNQSTDKWINHAARAQPVPDALPVLKDLGYGGSKATILSGAGKTDADSIKGLLLQGYLVIPDCSYTDYGASTIYNESKEMLLTTVVLAA